LNNPRAETHKNSPEFPFKLECCRQTKENLVNKHFGLATYPRSVSKSTSIETHVVGSVSEAPNRNSRFSDVWELSVDMWPSALCCRLVVY